LDIRQPLLFQLAQNVLLAKAAAPELVRASPVQFPSPSRH
jgi:hypothetical protein